MLRLKNGHFFEKNGRGPDTRAQTCTAGGGGIEQSDYAITNKSVACVNIMKQKAGGVRL